MAFSTEYIDGGRGVLHVGHGIVTGNELIAAAEHNLQAVRDGMPLRYGLGDFSGITRYAASPEEVQEVARIHAEIAALIGDAFTATIAPSDHAYGMSRLWGAYADVTGWEIGIFRTRAEADAWLAPRIAALDAKPRTGGPQE